VGLTLSYQALQLRPSSHDLNVWPHDHNGYRYLRMRDSLFELSSEQVRWGEALERRGVHLRLHMGAKATCLLDEHLWLCAPRARCGL
jgi:hypothetical protein